MRRALLLLALGFCVATAATLVWASRSTPYLRDRLLDALNGNLDSHVDADRLSISIFPRPQVSGGGLAVHDRDQNEAPPLITIESFSSSAGVRGLLGRPLHLHDVTLEGLNIRIPPRQTNPGTTTQPRDTSTPPPPTVPRGTARPSPLLIDEIVTRNATLQIESSKPGRLPRIFDIQNLVMSGYGRPEGATFRAALVNPVPQGRIDTDGTFGPWNGRMPGQTPVGGRYTFSNADLNTIDGIGGILSSTGNYRGVLERIEVSGRTVTPDFSIDIANQPVPLSTTFTAIVDGTNGDTWLDRVEATLGQSTIIAKGAVVRTQDIKGRRIALDVQITRAHLEDIMRLAVKGRPPIVGRFDMATKFLLPAGPGDVINRLQLDGRFDLAQARFTNIDVQKRITLLSQRGRGDDKADGTGESIVSNLRGQFVLRNAQLTFSSLSFAVPGAQVQLAGTYNIRGEVMDFAGNLLLDASLADMTHGFKSMLARLAQPFFRRPGGGSRLPIRITGTRANPSFGVDLKKAFLKR